MEEEKRAANTGGRGITDYIPEYKVAGILFRRAIGKQVVNHETKMPTKITKFLVTMDETFFNKDSSETMVCRCELLRLH